MRYEDNNRWQYQPWYVKLYRWVKFILPYYPRGWVYYLGGRLGVWRPETDHEKEVFISPRLYAKHLWTMLMSEVRYAAGHYYTSEEMVQRVRERRAGGEPTTTDGEPGQPGEFSFEDWDGHEWRVQIVWSKVNAGKLTVAQTTYTCLEADIEPGMMTRSGWNYAIEEFLSDNEPTNLSPGQ